ncbi:MAG: sigma-70 family RNA polymerase sigma factor [Candidatus Latescibacterota bacterium]
MADSDLLLIHRTLAGDRRAFGDLVERYTPLVQGVVWEALRRPDDVEDLTQQVFARAYERLPGLRRPARFAAWLWSIAGNAVADHQRRQQQQRALAVTAAGQWLRPARRPDEAVEEDERVRLLWEALDRLDPTMRQIVVLHYFEECSQRQIARFLDLSLTTVKWRLFQARARLRDELVDRLGDEVRGHLASRRRVREKVMALLPAAALLHPQPLRRPAPWWPQPGWILGGLAALGAGVLAYQELHSAASEALLVSREARQQLATVQARAAVTCTPARPQAGQSVRLAAGLPVEGGERPELHYVSDPWYPRDQVVPMGREDTLWVARFAVPREALALFFYVAVRGEGPQELDYTSYLTTRRHLGRYRQTLLVHDANGRPLPGALLVQARMARRLELSAETVLACADSELALHPEHFPAYAERWRALLEIGPGAPGALSLVRAEQEELTRRHADGPEALWWAAQVRTAWQDSLYRQLCQRFPDSAQAEEAAYLQAREPPRDEGDWARLAELEAFIHRFPASRYLHEAYRERLQALARTDPARAADLADSLIAGSLVVPFASAGEEEQRLSLFHVGGVLAEGYAYSVRFALLLREGQGEAARALARQLVISGVQDPAP